VSASDLHFLGNIEDFDESLTHEMMVNLQNFDEFSTDDAKEESNNRCNPLSLNAPGRTRTCNPRFRSNPAEPEFLANTSVTISIDYRNSHSFQGFSTSLLRNWRSEDRINRINNRCARQEKVGPFERIGN
jgi:hypothetical protein